MENYILTRDKKSTLRVRLFELERVKRIELSQSAWKAEVLPLNYTRILNGREDRIRTCDPLVPNQVLYQAEPLPEFYGAPKRSRTPNLLIRSQTLYPIELWALLSWCLGPESNRHGCHHPQDFKSCASTSSATQAFLLFQGTRLFLLKWCPAEDSNL